MTAPALQPDDHNARLGRLAARVNQDLKAHGKLSKSGRKALAELYESLSPPMLAKAGYYYPMSPEEQKKAKKKECPPYSVMAEQLVADLWGKWLDKDLRPLVVDSKDTPIADYSKFVKEATANAFLQIQRRAGAHPTDSLTDADGKQKDLGLADPNAAPPAPFTEKNVIEELRAVEAEKHVVAPTDDRSLRETETIEEWIEENNRRKLKQDEQEIALRSRTREIARRVLTNSEWMVWALEERIDHGEVHGDPETERERVRATITCRGDATPEKRRLAYNTRNCRANAKVCSALRPEGSA